MQEIMNYKGAFSAGSDESTVPRQFFADIGLNLFLI